MPSDQDRPGEGVVPRGVSARPSPTMPLVPIERPPASTVPIVLGGIGLAAFLMGFMLAVGGRSAFQQLSGLISLVIGAVLIAGAFIVDAITRLRVDLWRTRPRGRE